MSSAAPSEIAAKVVEALGRCAVFAAVPEPEREVLARVATPVGFEPGETIVAAGEPSDCFYVVLIGEVEVRLLSEGGSETRLAAFGPGEVFGEMGALDGSPRSADVVASTRVQTARIGREALIGLLTRSPAAAFGVLNVALARLRAANATIDSLRALRLKGRLAVLLLAESEHGRRVVQMTRTEMARRIGSSREKASKALHELAREGAVALSAAGVKVVSAASLEKERARER